MSTNMYPSIASHLSEQGMDVSEVLDVFDVGTFEMDSGKVIERACVAVKYLDSTKRIKYYRHEGPVTDLVWYD